MSTRLCVPLVLTVWRVDDTDVLRISGFLDVAGAVRLRLTLFARLDAGTRTVVVDLTDLRLMDAAAVTVLLQVQRRLATLGGGLTAPGAGGPVLDVLERAGAARQLAAYDVLDSRLAGLTADTAVSSAADAAGAHGYWGDEVNVLMGRFGALADDDKAGREVLRERVVRRCLPFADRLARRFYGLGEPAADLNQVAAVGLLKAIDRYDPTLGTDFPSFASPTIAGELKRHFRDRGWAVRVPRRLQERRLEINRARDDLCHRLGRAPTTADLAAHLGIEERAVREAIVAANAYRSMSLFTPVGTDEAGPALADRLGGEDAEYEAVETHQALRPLLAALPERERRIINLRFFGNMTQTDIAQRLGISQMHVSRLLARTLFRLREGLQTSV